MFSKSLALKWAYVVVDKEIKIAIANLNSDRVILYTVALLLSEKLRIHLLQYLALPIIRPVGWCVLIS